MLLGAPITFFFPQQYKKFKLPSTNGQTTPNNFVVWNVFDEQAHNVICGEDWDVEYFVDNLTKMSFIKVIHDMYEPNIEAWCAHVGGPSIQLDSIQRMLPNVAMTYLCLIHMKFVWIVKNDTIQTCWFNKTKLYQRFMLLCVIIFEICVILNFLFILWFFFLNILKAVIYIPSFHILKLFHFFGVEILAKTIM